MPFEVGKTLLQVEYKPKKGVESEEEERRWEEDMDGDGVDGVDGADGKEGKKEGKVWDENDVSVDQSVPGSRMQSQTAGAR